MDNDIVKFNEDDFVGNSNTEINNEINYEIENSITDIKVDVV